jgi:cell fate (sporulation/competence/biofilm development) regulator YlbF (YheA/YmcA/DUF963 family)
MEYSKIKNIVEKAIDKQYLSEIWGYDQYSEALYKLMMQFSGGILQNIENYKKDDIRSFKEAYDHIEKLLKEIDDGKSFKEINEELWYKTFEKIELYLGDTGLTRRLKNNSEQGLDTKEELKKVRKHLEKFMKMKNKKRKVINYIHNNKYRYAIKIVFNGI